MREGEIYDVCLNKSQAQRYQLRVYISVRLNGKRLFSTLFSTRHLFCVVSLWSKGPCSISGHRTDPATEGLILSAGPKPR